MLTIRNFSKSFSEELIISVPLLELGSGMHWIRGENGVGKTTFFKSLAGIIPSEGKIEFNDGISLDKFPVRYRERVNYAEAEPLYPGFLTSKDLIRFIGKARKSSAQQQDRLIEKFGVHGYFHKPCATYSSGMLKKLSLVLAFLGTPKLILLDEPLITLDGAAQGTLIDIMNEYMREQDTTILLSSHQPLDSRDFSIKQRYNIYNKTLTPISA